MIRRTFRGIAGCIALMVSTPLFAQAGTQSPASESNPDLSGIWQAVNTANWNLEPHAAAPGVPEYGTLLAIPPGPGVIVGGEIPYRPTALEQREKNRANRWTADPEVKCYMPGVPRANYVPYPFQIVQGSDTILIAYQYADAVRTIHLNDPGPAPTDSWMGWSVGRWEGGTLVVDVTDQNDETWLDRSGNYHSDELRVVERYTLHTPDILMYEATLEDPEVFSRPWTIRMPLHRHVGENAKLMEFNCIPFVEQILYEDIGRSR